MADKSLNKTELVAKVAADSGQSQAAVDGVLNAFFATLADTVANDGKVTILGWLGVERTATAARTGRNPQTGEEIAIAAGHRVKLTAGSKLKAAATSLVVRRGASTRVGAPFWFPGHRTRRMFRAGRIS